MSIDLPPGLDAVFDRSFEAMVIDKINLWLDAEPRSPGLHASDLLDPRKSYWDREQPQPRTIWESGLFFMGKWGESAIIQALEGLPDSKGRPNVSRYAGGVQRTSKELGLEYSPDWEFTGTLYHPKTNAPITLKKEPCEIKTTRTNKIAETIEDIRYYVEQCLIYMACMTRLSFLLLVWYMCAKDSMGKYRVLPQAIRITIPQESLPGLIQQVKEKIYHVKHCFDQNLPNMIPPCREWKCGERMCGHWDVCQPEGRYGKYYRDWEPVEPIEMFNKERADEYYNTSTV